MSILRAPLFFPIAFVLALPAAHASTSGVAEAPNLGSKTEASVQGASGMIEDKELPQYETQGARVTDPVGLRHLRGSIAGSLIFLGGAITSTVTGVTAPISLGLSPLFVGPPAQGLLMGGSFVTMNSHRAARADLLERGVRIDDRYFGTALALTVAGVATQLGGLGVGIALDAGDAGTDVENTAAIGLVTTPVGLLLSTLAIIPLAVERSRIKKGYLVVQDLEMDGSSEGEATRVRRSRVVVRPTIHGAGLGLVGTF